MIAAIYARKSNEQTATEEQRSIARQRAMARGYAERQGWMVGPEFTDDAVSGAEFVKRKGLRAMLDALPQRRFDVLVVTEVSRLGRDQVRTLATISEIVEAGVTIACVIGERHINAATFEDEVATLMLQVETFASTSHRRLSSRRTHDALRRKAEALHVCGGRVYGYSNVDIMGEPDRDGRRRRLYVRREVHPEQARIVQRIFTAYAEGQGLTRIAKALNRDSVPAPRGGTSSWAPTAVREILRRDLYRGVVVWDRSQKVIRRGTKGQRRRPENEWLKVEAPDLRIVDDGLWRAVEQRRARMAATISATFGGGRRAGVSGADQMASPYLLSGLTTCAECGGSLTAMTRPHGTGTTRHRVAMYGCAYHQKRGDVVCKNRLVIRQDKLDAAVIAAMLKALSGPVLARAIEKALARAARERAAAPNRRAELEIEAARVASGIQNLLNAIKRGEALDSLLTDLGTQEARQKAIARELADLAPRARVVPLDGKRLADRLEQKARQLRGELQQDKPRARRLLQAILNGQRIPCYAYEDGDERGYSFEATGTYGALFTDVGGPNGIWQ